MIPFSISTQRSDLPGTFGCLMRPTEQAAAGVSGVSAWSVVNPVSFRRSDYTRYVPFHQSLSLTPIPWFTDLFTI